MSPLRPSINVAGCGLISLPPGAHQVVYHSNAACDACRNYLQGSTMRNLIIAIAMVTAPAGVDSAAAQAYPSRPITLIVPFAAGGGTDVTARIVGEHMSRTLGQRIIVENVVGAGGIVGSTRAMRANP